MSIQARYQRAKKPSVKLTILEKYLPELSVWRWVKGWLKATTSVLSPLVLMIRKKRGERDPALKVTDNGGGRQLGLYSINWCLCVGHWPSKWKSKFLMPATVVFSGHTVNTGSAFKALSALTVNFLITLTIKILDNWNVSMLMKIAILISALYKYCYIIIIIIIIIIIHTHLRGKSCQPKLNNIEHVDLVWLVRLHLIIKFSSLIDWTHWKVPVQSFSITEPINQQSDRLGSIKLD